MVFEPFSHDSFSKPDFPIPDACTGFSISMTWLSTCTCSGPYSHWTLALFLVFPVPPPVSHSTSAVTSLGRALKGSQPSHCLLTGFPLQLLSSPTHGLRETDSPFHMAVIWSRTFLGSHCLWNRPSRIVAD